MSAGAELVLGIETSCDETAASVVRDGRQVLSNVVASQHELHETYGGVVPELASRAHLERIDGILHAALDEAGVTLSDIDAIAVGNRPGLIGSLLVGVSAAQALAWALHKPIVGVDHIQAHLYAAALHLPGEQAGGREPQYPALGLVISGGHTSLYHVRSPIDMTLLGCTIDDAVGEAYDKAAVILDAGYPGGPRLDALAQRGSAKGIDPLPRSMLGRESLDFSFSGLKTALLYRVRGLPQGRGEKSTFARSAADLDDQEKADLAAAFQQAAVQAVMAKLQRALDALQERGEPARSVIIGGGVSANSAVRREAAALGEQRGLPVLIPPLSLCVDNAAMIAGLAHHLLAAGRADDLTIGAIATTSM